MPTTQASRTFTFLAALASAGILGGCDSKLAQAAPPPPSVEVTSVVQRDVPITEEWVGTLDGMVNAEIRAQVAGYLLRQVYSDGGVVRKGDLLFEIDPRTFQAAYDQLKANFDKAELDLKRAAELVEKQVVSREDYDNAVQADLAAKAALESAQLNLDFTRIVSPIDGIAGIAAAQIGDLVGPASGALTTVSTVDPIKAYFSVSEQSYLDFERDHPGSPGLLDSVDLDLVLADGSVYPEHGRLFAVDRQIDTGTGTLRVAAVFPNPLYLLRPGQYVRVRGVVRVARGALLVPQRAVSELQGGYQVAVVDRENRAHIRNVQVGDRVGSLWIITKGLEASDQVVTEGVQKVREGTVVSPQTPDPQPGAN
jgi:membrane fusion protein (multidrug efflux system)